MRVATNAVWLSICRVVSDALSFALFVAIGRAFGPAGSGEYSYAFAICSVLVLLCSGGYEEYGTRQYARASVADRPRLWREIVSAQVAQAIIVLVLFGAFLAIDQRYGGDVQARVTVVLELAIFLVGWGLSRILFTPAMALQAMVMPAFAELACRLAAILVALGLWLEADPSLPLMLIGFPVSSLVLLCIAARNAASHGAALPALSRAGIVATWRQTLPFSASEVLNQFYARADLLLIAYLLGHADVGLYATDIKFVEVGLIPLVLLGTAAYPLLSRYAIAEGPDFQHAARDLVRTVLLLSGWLVVAMCTIIPLLIVPIFGAAFEPAAEHLPWFSVLALVKAAEIALYRLLYCVQRQTTYAMSLAVGTVLIVALNFVLIPAFGIKGAVIAGICSVGTVAAICVAALRVHISPLALLGLAMRQAVALAATAVVFVVGRELGLGTWVDAIAACCAFPVAAFVAGLVLNPSSSNLFEASRAPRAASHTP